MKLTVANTVYKFGNLKINMWHLTFITDVCNVLCYVNIVYVVEIHRLETNFILNLADSWHAKSNISSSFDCLKSVSCDTIATFP
jgi:hypothetical protein